MYYRKGNIFQIHTDLLLLAMLLLRLFECEFVGDGGWKIAAFRRT